MTRFDFRRGCFDSLELMVAVNSRVSPTDSREPQRATMREWSSNGFADRMVGVVPASHPSFVAQKLRKADRLAVRFGLGNTQLQLVEMPFFGCWTWLPRGSGSQCAENWSTRRRRSPKTSGDLSMNQNTVRAAHDSGSFGLLVCTEPFLNANGLPAMLVPCLLRFPKPISG